MTVEPALTPLAPTDHLDCMHTPIQRPGLVATYMAETTSTDGLRICFDCGNMRTLIAAAQGHPTTMFHRSGAPRIGDPLHTYDGTMELARVTHITFTPGTGGWTLRAEGLQHTWTGTRDPQRPGAITLRSDHSTQKG